MRYQTCRLTNHMEVKITSVDSTVDNRGGVNCPFDVVKRDNADIAPSKRDKCSDEH